MAITTDKFAETTEFDQISGVIDDTLRSLRISGSLLLREAYAPPWSIAIPDTDRLAGPLKGSARGRTTGASLLCGVFLLHHTAFNPLFAALPPLMRVTLSRPGELHNLAGVARLMAEEIDRKSFGGGYVVERLLEVLCAEAVRAHIEAVPRHETSWVRPIKDPGGG